MHLTTRFIALMVMSLTAVACMGHIAPAQEPRMRAYIPNSLGSTVSVIDLHEPAILETIAVGKYPRGVAVSQDGLVYVASQLSDIVSIIRIVDNKIVGAIPVDKGPYGVVVSPDGREVYVTHAGHFPAYGNTVSVIDAKTRQVVGTIRVGRQPIGIAVSPDGQRLYVADQWSPQPDAPDADWHSGLSVIEVATRASRTIDLDAGMATGIAVSPDGTYLYVAHETPAGIIRVVRTSDLTTVAKVAVGNGPFGVAVSPDGKSVYATNLGTAAADKTVSVIRTADWTVSDTITVGQAPMGIAVSPDGRWVLAVNRMSNTVSVIDAATRQVTATFPVGEEPGALGTFIGVVPPR